MYNPRKLVTDYVNKRETVLERIQSLIRKGHARTVDGERFVSHLGENRVRRALDA
jgi:hypothetical protein